MFTVFQAGDISTDLWLETYKAVGLKLVEHEVDDHTGDRDVHPGGKGPARDARVLAEPIFQAEV